MEKNQDISFLVVDYLTGEISQEDACALAEWVEASEENRREFLRMREAWIGATAIDNTYDGEAAFQRFKKRVLKHTLVSNRTWLQRHQYVLHKTLVYAAAILFPIMLICTTIMYVNISKQCNGEMVVSTVAGETSTIQLPDSTRVLLKENTRLSYSTRDFLYGKRNIYFEGEAYFFVSSDPSHPFLITTEKEEVRVLGTEFMLVSEKNSKTDVLSLDKGEVEFTDFKTGNVVHMEAGQELTYNTLTGSTFCRTRNKDEIKLARQKNLGTMPSTVYAELETNVKGTDGTCTIHLNVSQGLKPGLYQVKLEPGYEMACFSPAREVLKFQSGNGTKQHPYLINNARQMCNMKSVLKPYKMTYFALSSDINLKGVEWVPLNDKADDYALWVTLEGNGHVIRNLTTVQSCVYASFFGVLCGTCRNVGFENVNIFSTGYGAGAVAGYMGHESFPGPSILEDCYAPGRVCGQSSAGGLVGKVGSDAIMNRCHSAVDVTSVSSYAGGLVGKVRGQFSMNNCYSTGNVAGQFAGGVLAGGQTKDTPPSLYQNVFAINRSVSGSRNSYAVMPFVDGDTVNQVGYASGLYLNGKPMNHGMTNKELQEHITVWDHDWTSHRFVQTTE